MYMDIGLDTGDMLLKTEVDIDENETADELHDRLSTEGAKLIVEVVHAAAEGTLVRTPQNDAMSTYAPLLTREMSAIDFTKSAVEIHNQVRGLNSWPSAVTTLEGKKLKIHRTRLAKGEGQPGTILSLNPFVVACGSGAIEITELQPEGKKKMTAQDYLRGHKPDIHTILGQ